MLLDLIWSQTNLLEMSLWCATFTFLRVFLVEEAYAWVTWASLRLYPTTWSFLHREQDASQEAVDSPKPTQ